MRQGIDRRLPLQLDPSRQDDPTPSRSLHASTFDRLISIPPEFLPSRRVGGSG